MHVKIHPTTSPYSPEQVLDYLRKIKYEPLPENITAIGKTILPTLDNLNKIIRLHLIAFPFDNLSMH